MNHDDDLDYYYLPPNTDENEEQAYWTITPRGKIILALYEALGIDVTK